MGFQFLAPNYITCKILLVLYLQYVEKCESKRNMVCSAQFSIQFYKDKPRD